MLHRSTSTEPDHLDVELVASRAVETALAALDDPEARLRVLRWANEQCQIESMFASPVAAPPVVAAALVHAASGLRLAVASAPDAAPLRFPAAPEHGAPALRLAPAPEVDELEPEFEAQVGLSLDLEFEPAQPETDLRVDNLEDLFEAGTSPSPSFLEEEGMLLGEGDDVSGDHGAELEDLSDLYECEPPSAETFEEPIDLCEPPPQEPAQPLLHLVTRDEDQPFEQLIDDLVDNLQRLSDECLDA